MMTLSVFVWSLFILTSIPAVLGVWNLFYFRPLPPAQGEGENRRPPVSVLIPARNEAASIEACVQSVLANEAVELELIVLDDHSEDETSAIVSRLAASDPRLRCEPAPPMPEGWCGKQHACAVLANLARHDHLVWLDADVRFAPDALSRIVDHLVNGQSALISGFPYQETRTWMEKLVVPLIHVVLLSYLPIKVMRRHLTPGLGAGCGQLMISRREAYEAVGGHQAVKGTMHDGVTLPPMFRRAGYMTDVFDAGDLATCRMYDSASAVWQGFAKNAIEGLATPLGIWVWTLLLLGGHVLPWLAIFAWACGGLAHATSWQLLVLWGAWAQTTLLSVGLMYRFNQSYLSGLARPLGITLLLLIQWYALIRHLLGLAPTWRGRLVDPG